MKNLLPFLSLLIVLASPVQAKKTDVDICVIGAGPAGIQAAYSAEAKGYSVAVFEKNNYVGGKTKSLRTADSPVPYLMGATIHSERAPNNLQELAKKFNVQPWQGGVTVPEVKVGFYDGGTLVDDPTNILRLIPETLLYLVKRTLLSPSLDRPDAYIRREYPQELETMSFHDWLIDNGMPTVNAVFWQVFTTFGYGDTKDTPAVIGLKLASGLELLNLSFPFGFSSLKVFAFQELLEKMGESLKGTIYLEAIITNVDYYNDHTLIQYTLENAAPDATSTISCGSTIIAFAPTAEAMRLFTPPHSEELTELFDQVIFLNYYTLLFDDSDSAFDNEISVKYHVPLDFVPDHPALNLVCWKEIDIPNSGVVAYYLTPSVKTDQEALEESIAHYQDLIGRPVQEEDVRDFEYWSEYFPRVTSDSLRKGFFPKFDSFQGHYRQYYVGGLFNFEKVQTAMEHADFVIRTEF